MLLRNGCFGKKTRNRRELLSWEHRVYSVGRVFSEGGVGGMGGGQCGVSSGLATRGGSAVALCAPPHPPFPAFALC